jgi:hypothetical protein
MSKQWKGKTRGGDPVENVRPNNCSMWKWAGEVVGPDGGRCTLTWTERGYHGADEHPRKDDLIPEDKIIEPEAPSPAKARVDLALAAHSLRSAVENRRYAEAQKRKMSEAMLDAFVAFGKTEVVVKIDGDHYFFWAGGTGAFFRKIEVL